MMDGWIDGWIERLMTIDVDGRIRACLETRLHNYHC